MIDETGDDSVCCMDCAKRALPMRTLDRTTTYLSLIEECSESKEFIKIMKAFTQAMKRDTLDFVSRIETGSDGVAVFRFKTIEAPGKDDQTVKAAGNAAQTHH
jgi:hypothetical protein